jgi:hypothetical protein
MPHPPRPEEHFTPCDLFARTEANCDALRPRRIAPWPGSGEPAKIADVRHHELLAHDFNDRNSRPKPAGVSHLPRSFAAHAFELLKFLPDGFAAAQLPAHGPAPAKQP